VPLGVLSGGENYAEIKNEALSSSVDDDNTSLIKLGLLTEALLELGNAATSIKNLLLAGVKRVASAANVSVDNTSLLGATSCECISATTRNCGVYVLWMNASLHGFLLINTVIGSQARMPCVNRSTP
jgi:hypothetical protein